MRELASRRDYSQNRIDELRKALAEANTFASNNACVYVTGSLGRNEASLHSDLDVFIAGKSETIQQEGSPVFGEKNLLSHLDEICIQAELIKVSRRFKYENSPATGVILIGIRFTNSQML